MRKKVGNIIDEPKFNVTTVCHKIPIPIRTIIKAFEKHHEVQFTEVLVIRCITMH